MTAVREGAGRVYQLVRGQRGQRTAVLLALARLFDPQAGGGGALSLPSSTAAPGIGGDAGAGSARVDSRSSAPGMDFPM